MYKLLCMLLLIILLFSVILHPRTETICPVCLEPTVCPTEETKTLPATTIPIKVVKPSSEPVVVPVAIDGTKEEPVPIKDEINPPPRTTTVKTLSCYN